MRFDTLGKAVLAACVVVPGSLSVAGIVEVAGLAQAHAPASALSQIPGGLDGVTDARFTNFNNKLYRTPTTNKWVVVPTTNGTPATADQVLVVGTGRTASVRAREGVTSIGNNPTTGNPEFLNFGAGSLSTPRMNDAEHWAMGFRILSSTALDERLVVWNGSAFTVLRPADFLSNGTDQYTGSFNSANISNTDKTGFLAALNGFPATAESAVVDGGILISVEVTAPTGQSTPTNVPLSDLDINQFYQDSTGTHYALVGKVGNDTAIDRVIVVDGAVVIQKGTILPGSGFSSPVNTITTANDGLIMESDGTWFAWGANVDGKTWVVRNGVVIASSGSPITLASSELWESFRSARGDNHGHYIVNGNTNASTLTDDVIVADGQTVAARESDPVDLDGNGTVDAGMYVHLVQNHSVLMDDGYCYFAARVKANPGDTAGVGGSTAASLLRVRAFTPASPCGTSDFDGDGDFGTDADIEAFFACLGGNCCALCFPGGSDFNGDGDFGTDADIESFFRVLGGGPC